MLSFFTVPFPPASYTYIFETPFRTANQFYVSHWKGQQAFSQARPQNILHPCSAFLRRAEKKTFNQFLQEILYRIPTAQAPPLNIINLLSAFPKKN